MKEGVLWQEQYNNSRSADHMTKPVVPVQHLDGLVLPFAPGPPHRPRVIGQLSHTTSTACGSSSSSPLKKYSHF